MLPSQYSTRIVISGIPRSGKTTLAESLAKGSNTTVLHTDTLIGDRSNWSEESNIVANGWMARGGSWIIEGVTALRALRKWLKNNPQGRPCDVVYWSEIPKENLTPGQAAMGLGHSRMWPEIRSELSRRGCEIRTF